MIAGWTLQNFLATITLFHDGMAIAAVELAASLAHKCAVDTLFNSCTNHGYHILSSIIALDMKQKKEANFMPIACFNVKKNNQSGENVKFFLKCEHKGSH